MELAELLKQLIKNKALLTSFAKGVWQQQE